MLSAIAGQGAWVDHGDGPRPLRVPELSPDSLPRLSTNRYLTLQADWPTVIAVAGRTGIQPPSGPRPFHPRAWYPETDGPEYEAFLGIGRGPNGAAVGGEWDLAAPDLILREAGGEFTDERGQTIIYNKDDASIRHGIIAVIDPAMTSPAGGCPCGGTGRCGVATRLIICVYQTNRTIDDFTRRVAGRILLRSDL